MATVRTTGGGVRARFDLSDPISDDGRAVIARMDNNALIVRLLFTLNHLSRWLSPVHDPNRLERSLYRGEPTVKELLIGMRDRELAVFPRIHLIAVQDNPDLDQLADPEITDARRALDHQRTTIALMSEFRRLRQSTCSTLRALPDAGWRRQGTSRRRHDVTIRELAEGLAEHDLRYLRVMDEMLDRVGAREGLAPLQTVHLDDLLKLVPERVEI
jgi:hypothetical protein